MRKYISLLILPALIGLLLPNRGLAEGARAATLYIAPATGSFVVGNTFSISLYVNTGNQSINAVDAELSFPPDILQVTSPSSGHSFISTWTAQPTYSNIAGTARFQGGLPSPGINTEAGLISTITFRVKSVGKATIKISSASKILLNDGLGTDILGNTSDGIYDTVLPPPAGPTVVSSSHPDQTKWYNSANVDFSWTSEGKADGYSYELNHEPISSPDDISEGTRTGVFYKNMADGIYYFHIKSLEHGAWGGTTHYEVRVDTTPPAEFPVEVTPAAVTTKKTPVITFSTTDNLSGISHYELMVASLTPPKMAQAATSDAVNNASAVPFFVEAASPQVLNLDYGTYDTIVNAYDSAGNVREEKARITIAPALFQFVGDQGLVINSSFVVSWVWVFIIAALILSLLGYGAWKARKWHYLIDLQKAAGALDDPIIKARLKELRDKKKAYSKLGAFLLLVSAGLILSGSRSYAETNLGPGIPPPIITVVSKDISNQELFYVGGSAGVPGSEIIVYLQNYGTGETLTESVAVDKKGDWFYSHPKFLESGKYILWAQEKEGNDMSPPSPQVTLSVTATALQFGASRLSFETLYLLFAGLFLLLFLALVVYILYHIRRGHKKRAAFARELKEAEDSIRRGFATIRHDIEKELEKIRAAKAGGNLSAEEMKREETLLSDLESVKKHLTKEIWEMEKNLPK